MLLQHKQWNMQFLGSCLIDLSPTLASFK